MRNVIFVAPFWMEATLRFVDAIRDLESVRLLGICQQTPDGHRPEDLGRFADVVQVADCFNEDQVEEAARALSRRHGPLFRIVNILEHAQPCVARVRSRLGLPGLTPEAADRFTDKAIMKEHLRRLGLPCAKSRLLRGNDEARDFAREVGFPIILKPPVGAGCKSTYQVGNPGELEGALGESKPSPEAPVQAEEFIQGDEYSFDTVTLDGKVVFHSITRYEPTPLEAMRTPWIQWTHYLPREIDGPEYDEVRRVGIACAEGLGMASGITHMEWFRRRDGSVVIGEIAARPPGGHIVRGMSYAHDADFYRVWARATVDGCFDGPFQRKWAVGVAFLRGQGQGRVAGTDFVPEANARVGSFVVEARLPQVGAPKVDSYEGDGYAIVRHADTDTVRTVLREIVGTLRVRYE